MAEGFLKSLNPEFEVFSAGTNPSDKVHPKAIIVMNESGIDLRNNYPKNVDSFLKFNFDYVITVCGEAKESCPAFSGNVTSRQHIGFDDPAEAVGTEEEIFVVFRRVRDEIKRDFTEFYKKLQK